MTSDNMLGFETDPSQRQITVWRDDGNGKVLSIKIALPVSRFQEILRSGAMVDDGTIRWIAEDTPVTGALRVRDAASLLNMLQPFYVDGN